MTNTIIRQLTADEFVAEFEKVLKTTNRWNLTASDDKTVFKLMVFIPNEGDTIFLSPNLREMNSDAYFAFMNKLNDLM